MDDFIANPRKDYVNKYKGLFKENAEKYLDEIIKKTGVNAEENKQQVKEYDKQVAKVNKIKKTLSGKKAQKAFSIFAIILLFVGAILSVVFAVTSGRYEICIPCAVVGLAGGIGLIFLIIKKLNPVIKHLKNERDEEFKKAENIRYECMGKMKPLVDEFTYKSTRELIQKTLPLFEIDEYFDEKRFDMMHENFGFNENGDINSSTVETLSGIIKGNPFLVSKDLVHKMGTCSYSGSLTIHWTTRERDSNGHTRTVHHTQTLVATVVKPKPYYHYSTKLTYCCEAAPDLHFSRTATDVEKMNERQVEKTVKKGSKKLKKIAEKSAKSGGNFTEMANSEFDVLFGAHNRDNEVQFRLMFTPLAQQNMVDLIKVPDPFGDDFNFYKDGKINVITTEHSVNWDMNTDFSRFLHHDLEVIKQNFMTFQEDYFKNFYFQFAPLLCVPVYQQHKTIDYIYKKDYKSNFNMYEAEVMANTLDSSLFAPTCADTRTIIKASLIGKEKSSDKIRLHNYSYNSVERVDYIPKLGGDGRIHNVPVPWIEYIPVYNEATISMKSIGLQENKFRSCFDGEKTFSSYGLSENYGYKKGLIACLVGDDENAFDEKIDKFFNNKGDTK